MTPSNTPHSPGQLIFGVDMIFCQKIKIDWALLKKWQCDQALTNNKKDNRTGRTHTYKVGDLVLIVEKAYEQARTGKLSSPTEGPYQILAVYDNGNVLIRGGNFDEDISIHRLCPHYNRD